MCVQIHSATVQLHHATIKAQQENNMTTYQELQAKIAAIRECYEIWDSKIGLSEEDLALEGTTQDEVALLAHQYYFELLGFRLAVDIMFPERPDLH